MAQAGNPGTPPAVGAPDAQGGNQQGAGNNAQGTPNPEGKRLIAGKYETLEDAVEQGIGGMEKAFHQTREDLARVTRILEAAVAPQDPRGGYAPVGSRGQPGYGGYDYGRGPQNDPDYIDPAQFVVNPSQFLRARESRIMQQVAGVVENVVANAMVVEQFKRENPDLVPHERIVRAFMNETDQRQDYQSRLKEAARLTKEYLVNVRAQGGGNINPAPNGNNFVEFPRGPAQGAQAPLIPGGNAPQVVDEEERELMEYISERNKDMAARFGIKT